MRIENGRTPADRPGGRGGIRGFLALNAEFVLADGRQRLIRQEHDPYAGGGHRPQADNRHRSA